MGWQDREYARPASRGVWSRGGGGAPSWLWNGSIVTTLIIVNVAIFVIGGMSPAIQDFLHGGHSGFGAPSFGFGELRAGLVAKGQIWRLFTAQYLHAGMGHLFMNMLVLHFLGRALEQMWSARKFFTIYTICGLAGNLFFTILFMLGDPAGRFIPAVGASGCIYGLLGIVAVLFPTATVYIYFLFPLKIRTAAFIFGGISLYSILGEGANWGGEACHLAGMVFGVWWAMKGDAWWSRRRAGIRTVRPRRQTPKSTSFRQRVAQRQQDAVTVDAILKKVYDSGIHSLTESEKRQLQDATARQQAQESEAGRVDRL